MSSESGILPLFRELSLAGTAAEVAVAIARYAEANIADGALIYGSGLTPGALYALASMGLPRSIVEVAQSMSMVGHTQGPERFELEPPVRGGELWAAARDAALEAGFRRGLCVPVRHSGAVVGCLLLFSRAAALEQRLALALASEVGPALARALKTDHARWERDILAEALPLLEDGVLCVSSDGEQIFYNRGLEALVGWTVEDVRARGWTHLVYPDPVYRAEVTRGIAALLMGTPSEGVERTLSCADGRSIQAAIWSRATPHPSGGPPAMLGVIRDVTPARELVRQQRREENLIQLGRLAGTVAHDLNNLLCSVMGHADLLTLPGRSPAQVEGHAETILSAAESGGRLAGQLLLLSGTAPTSPASLDLSWAARQALRLFQPELDEGIRLTFHGPPALPLAEVDPLQLQQVLANLLANARDALGGAGTIQVSVAQAAIPASAHFRAPSSPQPGAQAVLLRVQDSGPGFSKDAMDRLLEPFFTTKQSGHGLGMSAVRGALAANRGVLVARNDGGAVIEIYLPISERPEAVHQRLSATAEGGGRRIWMVDDQEPVLEFSKISLEARGYKVRAFSTAAAALEAARRSPEDWPEALILDVLLADGNGQTLSAALRVLGLTATTLWISGYVSPEHTPAAREAFLQKPFTGRDLAAAVGRLLTVER